MSTNHDVHALAAIQIQRHWRASKKEMATGPDYYLALWIARHPQIYDMDWDIQNTTRWPRYQRRWWNELMGLAEKVARVHDCGTMYQIVRALGFTVPLQGQVGDTMRATFDIMKARSQTPGGYANLPFRSHMKIDVDS